MSLLRSLTRASSIFLLAGAATSSTACSTDLEGELEGTLDIDFSAQGESLTIEAFTKLCTATGGKVYVSTGTGDMAALTGQAMTDALEPNVQVDIAFVVDTTGSMGDDIEAVKTKLSELVAALEATNPDWQVAIIEYRDKGDSFISRTVQPLSGVEADVQAGIDTLMAAEGGDYCEHAYAGLDTAFSELTWRDGAAHRAILIGDAPPHEYADDMRNYDATVAAAMAEDVQVYAVVPNCDDICALAVQLLGGGACD